MCNFKSFEERFEYLKLNGTVGETTFGFNRYLNQNFYSSQKWKTTRSNIIIRDNGCDLGIENRPLFDRIYIHHINPISMDEFENNSSLLFDPNNLVCVSYDTHLAIHYGDFSLIPIMPKKRYPGDTILW